MIGRRSAVQSAVLAACAAGVACASAPPPEDGLDDSLRSLEQSPILCEQDPAVRDYFAQVWHALQDDWTLPPDLPDDQRVTVAIRFAPDGGLVPRIELSTNLLLRQSVEDALAKATLPAPPEAARACLAAKEIRADFRNPRRD